MSPPSKYFGVVAWDLKGDRESSQTVPHLCPTVFPKKTANDTYELPQYPWQKVGVDLFHLNGTNYIILVNYFSRYPEVQRITSTSSTTVINWLKSTFSRFGIPETVISDNGPQFASNIFLTLQMSTTSNMSQVAPSSLRAMDKWNGQSRQ